MKKLQSLLQEWQDHASRSQDEKDTQLSYPVRMQHASAHFLTYTPN